VEKLQKVLGITVFTALFFSMFLSFMVTLSSNINVIDVTASFCPQTHQEVIVYDQDEQELAKEHKILIEKNVISTQHELAAYDVIKHTMLAPKTPHFFELSNDIFYPPKYLSA
jgi:hypothetical protein